VPALLALTTTLAAELDNTPVIVNAVDPSLTATWPGAEAMGARPVADSVPGIVWAATPLTTARAAASSGTGSPSPGNRQKRQPPQRWLSRQRATSK